MSLMSLMRSEGHPAHKAIVSVRRRALECCLLPSPESCDPGKCTEQIEIRLQALQFIGAR
jgi:hypothetical protein